MLWYKKVMNALCVSDISKDGAKLGGIKMEEEEDGTEDGKTPSFAVLLHGSLKVESMVAITKIG